MAKLRVLKYVIEKKGTEAMKAWVFSAEKIQKGFEKVFFEEDISIGELMSDINVTFEELKEEGMLKIKGGKIFMENVLYIVRHTWKLEDKYGKTKTGDDLHKASSNMFKDTEMLGTEALFKELENRDQQFVI